MKKINNKNRLLIKGIIVFNLLFQFLQVENSMGMDHLSRLENLKEIAKNRPIRILSIDGGGMRGLIPLRQLQLMENQLRRDTGKGIYESFDLFVGTSIGGILAIALSQGKKPDELMKLFCENGENIFTYKERVSGNFGIPVIILGILGSLGAGIGVIATGGIAAIPLGAGVYFFGAIGVLTGGSGITLGGDHLDRAIHTKYTREYLDILLENEFGRNKMHEKKPYMVGVTFQEENKQEERMLMSNFVCAPGKSELSKAKDKTMFHANLSDFCAAQATSAAPTYFDLLSSELDLNNNKCKVTYKDGGLLFNNPIKSVLEQLDGLFESEGIPNAKFVVASFGTGSTSKLRPIRSKIGALDAALTLLRNIDLHARDVDEAMKSSTNEGEKYYNRLQYFRFQPELKKHYDLDSCSEAQINELKKVALDYIMEKGSKQHNDIWELINLLEQ